jgi:hypothetical protein
MQDNVLEIIKRRLENESEMAYSDFEEYAELYGFNESDDFFSAGLKRAIEIISVYIRLEKEEKNDANNEVLDVDIQSIEQLQKIQAIVFDCLSPCSLTPIEGMIAIKKLLKKENEKEQE